MLGIQALFIILHCILVSANEIHLQVVKAAGARLANQDELPMIAAIYQNKDYVCIGALVSSKVVLSAATCFESCHKACMKNRHLMFGDLKNKRDEKDDKDKPPKSRQKFSIRQLYPHERHVKGRARHNIIIIELKGEVVMSASVKAIDLTQTRAQVGAKCKIAGWMSTLPIQKHPFPLLIVSELKVLENLVCANKLFDYEWDTMVCAGDLSGVNDSCVADIGSPLVCDNKMYGILSFTKGCALKWNGVVFTDVASYKDWLSKHMFEISLHKPERFMTDSCCRSVYVNKKIFIAIITLAIRKILSKFKR